MRTKKKLMKGGVELSEGPIDTFNHTFAQPHQISYHIGDMKRKKDILHNQKKRYIDKYNIESSKKQDQKNRDEIFKKNKQQEARENKQVSDSREYQNIVTSINQTQITITHIIDNLKWLIIVISKFLKWLIDGIIIIIGFIITSIIKMIQGDTTQSVVSWILVILLILFVIVLVLLLIAYTITQLTRPAQKNSTPASNKCSKYVPSNINITLNVEDWKLLDDKTFNTILDKVDAFYKPKFEAIKLISAKTLEEILKDPTSYLMDILKSLYDKFMNNDQISSLLRNLNYLKNSIEHYYRILTNTNVTQTTDRDIISAGRCDNITYIDSSLFPKQLLREKNIDTNNTVINLNKPMDIKWTLPELEYNGLDIHKLPPYLVNKKNSNNVSLEDKKKLIIPWKSENNYYVLSCDDAYFDNVAKEKANVFIDIDDTTCTYNIQSVAHLYNADKKRYAYTDDLSSYI